MDPRRTWMLGLACVFFFASAGSANAQCTFSLTPTSQEFTASGGTGLVTINALPLGCTTARTASTSDSWITINFGQSGLGAGSVGYTIAANTGNSARTGSISIAGQTFSVTQAGAACVFSLSPNSQTFTSDGGTGAVTINASPSGCQTSRTSTTTASWITLSSGASGNGAGTLVYTVSANSSATSRTANITIAGQTFTVTQGALNCAYSINPSQANFPASGGNDQITLTASPVGCSSARTAISNNSWITISFGATGNGSGTVGYTVATNSFTVARTGSITAGGQTFTVNQAAGSCSFTLSPASSTIATAGGTSGFSITPSNQGCSWTAVNNAPDLITITSGDSGTGSGRIDYSVGPNTLTTSRTGTISIGSAAHTVTQNSACRVTATPTGANFAGSGGSGTIAVSTQGSNCSWTATSNHPFITISTGASGTSAGTVNYTVAANVTGADRVGSISINDFGFTIYQSSNCSYILSSTTASIGAGGGNGAFSITTTCPWTAVPSADWILVTPTTGTGIGAVGFNIAGNTSSLPRTGTITIGASTFRINQDGVSCSVQVSPASFSAPSAGGAYTVNVEAPPGCDWTASSTASFISIAKGDSGFTFTVAANSQTDPRKAVITAGDKTINVSQEAAVCDFVLTPNRASFGSSGGPGSFAVATSCSWTAQSQAPWIVVPQTTPNSGDGNVNFNVARLTSADGRTGTIRIGTSAFTVTQTNSPCGINVTPQTVEISGAGGRAVLRVNGGPSCRWSPQEDTDWITITSWSSINGTGVVNVSAPPNPGIDAREGNIRINANGVDPQIVTVRQGGLLPVIDSAVNAISLMEGGPFAPGTRIRLKGASIGPADELLADLGADSLPTDLSGVQVLFNGIPAPLISVSGTSITALVPFAVAGSPSADIVVRNTGVDSAALTVDLAAATPAILTADTSTGRGQAQVTNQNGSANSASNAAARNEMVSFLITGAGQVRPDAQDGLIYRQPAGLPVPVQTVTVQIGGQAAAVTAAAVAPNETAGVVRVTARIAQNATTGTSVPVVIRVGQAAAQTGVTMAVR